MYKYLAVRRIKELYFPNTISFQYWLALLSFSLFIFTIFVRYSPSQGGWLVMDTLISEINNNLIWVFFAIGMASLLFGIFAFISLIIVGIRAFIEVKVPMNTLKDVGQINKEIRTKMQIIRAKYKYNRW
jgi:hypothetical protein